MLIREAASPFGVQSSKQSAGLVLYVLIRAHHRSGEAAAMAVAERSREHSLATVRPHRDRA